ncbi:hypothetical protein D5b_00108 [Faustovirus]|nr:hypothetical protein D5b_00108 [Faustovirus]AMN84802.1 hypothetical protein D6_00402 [Faustovirus]AMP44066.1 hypothetical protein PRJ_Dakar_00107 [Faustovirus]QKE50484.1 hypothetical protein F-VV10_0364 [Faustovirus]
MSNEEVNSEYLQRFDTMGSRLEEIAGAISGVKAAKTKGIVVRMESVETCLDHIFAQLKDIHETLIDLNNNFVDSGEQEQAHE